MADVPVQVIVAAFKDLDGASNALKTLQEAKHDKLIGIQDAAVITKDSDGKVKIKETADMRAGKGATIGAVAGGVVGLLAGPVGWAALGGGVIGGLAAKLRDSGFPDERLKQVAEGLTPNSSALVAVIDHRWVAEVQQELEREQADFVMQSLSDDIHQQLTAGADVTYTVVGDGDTVIAARGTSQDAAQEISRGTSQDTSTADMPATAPSNQADSVPPPPA